MHRIAMAWTSVIEEEGWRWGLQRQVRGKQEGECPFSAHGRAYCGPRACAALRRRVQPVAISEGMRLFDIPPGKEETERQA